MTDDKTIETGSGRPRVRQIGLAHGRALHARTRHHAVPAQHADGAARRHGRDGRHDMGAGARRGRARLHRGDRADRRHRAERPAHGARQARLYRPPDQRAHRARARQCAGDTGRLLRAGRQLRPAQRQLGVSRHARRAAGRVRGGARRHRAQPQGGGLQDDLLRRRSRRQPGRPGRRRGQADPRLGRPGRDRAAGRRLLQCRQGAGRLSHQARRNAGAPSAFMPASWTPPNCWPRIRGASIFRA